MLDYTKSTLGVNMFVCVCINKCSLISQVNFHQNSLVSVGGCQDLIGGKDCKLENK